MTMRGPIAAIAALTFLGLTPAAQAQMLGAGMPMPGAAPPQQQQLPPCFREFAPLRAEAEKRANGAEGRDGEEGHARRGVRPVQELHRRRGEGGQVRDQANAQACGIPPEAAAQMKANHSRTIKTQTRSATAAASPARRSRAGPGLSEALGTTRAPAARSIPIAPQSGTMNTLTGNVLAR